MPTSTVCPVDPTLTAPAECFVFAGDVLSVPADPPPPGPGDPGTPFVPATPSRLGRRVQLLLTEPVSHRPLALVDTAKVHTVSFGFGPGSLEATAMAVDSVWEVTGYRTTTAYGRNVHMPDLKGVDAKVGLDGAGFWSGSFREPQRLPGGLVGLAADSGEAVLDERALGETEQHDYYEGRGSFPTESLAGWAFDANVSHVWNTSSPYEGARSLRVEASGARAGRVYGPWVAMPGQAGQVRYPVASMIVRLDSDLVMQVLCEVRKPDGTVVASDFTIENRGVSDDGTSGYQGPIAGRGRLTPAATDHLVRAVAIIPAGAGPVDIDLVRLQWPTLTGFPGPTDLAYYPGRILRDAQHGAGGSSLGISTSVLELSGVLSHLTYPHQSDIPIGQAMRGIREMVDGPDWYITPGWRCVVGPRGRVRDDVALTIDNIISLEMTPDPSGEVDEFRGLTNIGSQSYRHVFGFDQPRRPNRRRTRSLVSVPDELTDYDDGRSWAEGQAAYAAQPGLTAVATVAFDEGLQYGEGDQVRIAWCDGDSDDANALWGLVHVAGRTFDFDSDTCQIQLAAGSSA